ncbi:CDP-glucose 4,6-dehydratase [Bacillus cereus]|uniref:CDP-glucose 4,6-dehydratase n=1 Tax=Bacillus cereus TaxID=1396 RepID=UPI0009953427|nr:CDP-glucose 4,6-dehydratase [Bacillus cereus]OPA05173.1 CDP-glucose 4,6-dehydratase [Bacillus cereus]
MRTINPSLFKDKKILITGHTGFKGSWLTLWLTKLGAQVIGVSLNSGHEKGIFNSSKIKKDVIDIRGDIRDYALLESIFKKYNPDIIFHLAAQPLVKYSYQHPQYTYDVNVMGTLNVLEAMRVNGSAQTAIFVTSDKCYENKEWTWGYRENDPMGGIDPYSSSKGCCELLISSYRDSYFSTQEFQNHQTVIATVRAGNVIGGGDWSLDRIIPDTVNYLKEDKDIIVRLPHAVRPWQHVLEALSGYIILTANLLQKNVKYSGSWNFGPYSKDMISVKELVELFIQIWGSGRWREENISNAVHEAQFLSLDISKANRQLHWFPKWDIYESIEKTVEWYKQYETSSIQELCHKQINEYCNL